MQTQPLRYAVIGAGGISHVHLKEIAGQPGVTVVGLADTADPKTWRVPAEHAAAPRFQDAEKMLRETHAKLKTVLPGRITV